MDELCFDFADLCFDFLLLHSVQARAAHVLTFCICFDIPQATVPSQSNTTEDYGSTDQDLR